MIESFLLIGQSNMAGRGIINEVKPIQNRHIYLIKNGMWRPWFLPIHWDDPTAGTCLAEAFADAYQKDHPEIDVGLIPCAEGGTCLDQWLPGTPLFESAVFQAKQAQLSSVIKGILWHQGEADCKEDRFPLYEEKCTYILQSIRDSLNLNHVPLLVGGLGDFLSKCELDNALKNYTHVNNALKAISNKIPNVGFVPADDLAANPDNLHFCAKALREFGDRYYDMFKQLVTKEK